jgi:hypothetical protein
MMEAFRILDRQEASIQDVDTAMKLGAGMPMGPLELADVSVFIFEERTCLIKHLFLFSLLVWIQ